MIYINGIKASKKDIKTFLTYAERGFKYSLSITKKNNIAIKTEF